MHLVDEVDLVPAGGRPVSHGLPQGAHVVDARIAGSVDFNQIEEAFSSHAKAVAAPVARLRLNALKTIHRFRKDAGNRRLARAPFAGKHVRVTHAVLREGILKNPNYVPLTDNFPEPLRPVLVVQGPELAFVCHRGFIKTVSPELEVLEGGRAPTFERRHPPYSPSAAPARIIRGAQGLPLTAASFRT